MDKVVCTAHFKEVEEGEKGGRGQLKKNLFPDICLSLGQIRYLLITGANKSGWREEGRRNSSMI